MRSASVSNPLQEGRARPTADRFLTEGERPFPNAKLGGAALIVYKSAADLVSRGALFAITIVAARRLGAREFGLFGLGTTLGWLIAVASDFGVQMHLARAVAREPAHAFAHLGRWWRFRLGAAAAGVGVFALGLLLSGASRQMAITLSLFVAVAITVSFVELLNYFYRGLDRTDIESGLTAGYRIATLVLALAALWWRPSVDLLAVAMLIPAACALAWSRISANGMAPNGMAPNGMGSTRGSRADIHGAFFGDVFPVGLGIVLSAIYFRVDVLLVQLWSGTEAVAAYNAVFRLIDALRLFPAAVLAVMLPALCRAETLRPLARVAAPVTLFGAAAAAALWLAADRIVPLAFGSPYAFAAPAFRILALSFPLMCLNFALTHQLIAWSGQRSYAAVCAAALALNVALNAALIPRFAIDGAAWATLGTEMCVTAGCAAAMRVRP